MNYRIQAWVNVAVVLIELGVAYWCSETSDPFGVVLSIAFAAVFAIVAALYFWLGRKRQPRIVIKATTLADAQRIIENLARKDVR